MASVRNVSVTYLGRKKITKRMQKLIHDIRFFLFWGENRNNFDDVRMRLISNDGKAKYTCESKLGRAVRCRDHKLVFGPEIGKRFC